MTNTPGKTKTTRRPNCVTKVRMDNTGLAVYGCFKQESTEENSFRHLPLNQWVKQAVRWMPMEKWDKCAFIANEDSLEGRVCYAGLDLSSTTDIMDFVLVFLPLNKDDKFSVLPYFWIPEDNLDLCVYRDHVPYREQRGPLRLHREIHRAAG